MLEGHVYGGVAMRDQDHAIQEIQREDAIGVIQQDDAQQDDAIEEIQREDAKNIKDVVQLLGEGASGIPAWLAASTDAPV